MMARHTDSGWKHKRYKTLGETAAHSADRSEPEKGRPLHWCPWTPEKNAQ